jgi:N-acyl-phosphatidylethanolamine-hydrolysing phospholipase D
VTESADPLYAPHYARGRYFTPWARFPNRLVDVLRWKLSPAAHGKRGALDIPLVANDGAYLRARDPRPSLTWVGHSTFALQDGGEVVLTDPHWGARALLPPRLSPPGIPLGAVPPDAFVVLSHNHYDHLDDWTARHLPPSIPWFVPLGLRPWLRRRGVRQVTELDWWQSVRHGRWTLTALPAQHWSNRVTMKRNSTLWCSWMLDSGDRRTYFSGDSGYFSGFAEIGRRFAPIEVALLPIGAYEPRWFMRPQHMNPAESLQSFLDLGAGRMAAMHWGCFDLTDESPDEAPRVLRRLLEGRPEAARVSIPAVGERIFLDR